MTLATGDRLGAYEILEPIGEGGMGEVYRARHEKLGRDVAIKVLPSELASDGERLRRFEREARSASALNHPNIVTIHDIAEHDGTTFIAMELVSGRTLRDLLEDGPVAVERVLDIAIQVADGLEKAHGAGIVHRDLKPENVMLTDEGLVKILDFGIAKPVAAPGSAGSELPTATKATAEGIVVGTVHYMSPEQATGGALDHRSDQFAFGAVLYELLSGQRPFEGETAGGIIASIVHESPRPLEKLRPRTPAQLVAIVRRCLEKSRDERYAATTALRDALKACRRAPRSRGLSAFVAVALFVAVAAAVVLFRSAPSDDAAIAVAEITRSSDAGDLFGAYQAAHEARQRFPGDETIARMFDRITLPSVVTTEPPGASVHVARYRDPDEWVFLGNTPLDYRIPYTLMRWRISKEGYESFEGAPFGPGPAGALAAGISLDPEGSGVDGMVLVPGGTFWGVPGIRLLEGRLTLELDPYRLDRFEVTNEAFQEFVDDGGYERAELWSTIERAGREISFDEAASSFEDATGRTGPSTWQLGRYPEGTGEQPVGGVSWYEADAYCRYAGKSLPTVHHWFFAAAQDQLADIVRVSNFEGNGPAPAGAFEGLGDFGTYDMAGNLSEWVLNAAADERFLLGGSWQDPPYTYKNPVASPPMSRLPTNGFRCALYPQAIDPVLTEPLSLDWDFSTRQPLSDEVFEAYLSGYRYDRTPLRAELEERDDSSPHWIRERVSFDAAYDNERVAALLFLPRGVEPPYQTVVWFPGDDAFFSRTSDQLGSAYLFDFIPRGGRAFVYPIYKGMYERFVPFSFGPNEWRDRVIDWSKDLRRTVDYLETRDDIATDALAYYGFSSGANYGPIFMMLDDRFAASILLGGGLWPNIEFPPEMDVVNFAPRSTVPTLLINGRDDYMLPFEQSQRPLFALLGAAPENKRHARLAGGHIPSDPNAIIREVLEWLDTHLGPL